MEMLGMSHAAEAVSTPQGETWRFSWMSISSS
jgi:hypothetical protein